jgi:outer membrane lipoprotein SlyB
MAQYQARVDAAPTRESELVALTRDYDTLQKVYTNLLAKKEDSKVAANLERRQAGEQFRVLDPARLPERPFSPNRMRMNLMGAVAGLAVGLIVGSLIGLHVVLLACGLGALAGAFAGVMVGLHGAQPREATREHPVEARGGRMIAVCVDRANTERLAMEALRVHNARDLGVTHGEWRDGSWRDFDPRTPLATG